jgi:hypothetical protein
MPDAFSNITALLEMQQYRWPNQQGCLAAFDVNKALLLNNISILIFKIHIASQWNAIFHLNKSESVSGEEIIW